MLSPQMRRCCPSCHMSPGCVIGGSSSSMSGTSSCCTSCISSGAEMSKPNCSISKSANAASSFSSSSKSQSASSAVLLSASLNALICSGVRSSAIMHGTVSSPSLRAAFNRVCPATITLSRSIMIGTLNPNSFMLAATASTAASLCLGLFAYSFKSAIGKLFICNDAILSFSFCFMLPPLFFRYIIRPCPAEPVVQQVWRFS